MWGNPEDMPALRALADAKRVPLIEDTCLSLGARAGGRMAGSWGDVAVFSFGCLKPIQGGEGGMILTNDRALAKEMRALRHWGDRTAEFGVRDTLIPSWNGRMSEVVAAVVREQLKGYPAHLAVLQRNVGQFARYLEQQPGLRLVLGHGASIVECAFTQIILELVPEALPVGKAQLLKRLYAAGVPVWHANFEPINTLTLFASSEWRNWMPYADLERVATNYARPYRGAGRIFEATGIGLGKSNFLSAGNLRHLIKALDAAIRE
jgi:dTDP-4-amino-4,6-dideoxygalactose transaminase